MGRELDPVLNALEKWGGWVLAYRRRTPKASEIVHHSLMPG